jgi:hypothetical protein
MVPKKTQFHLKRLFENKTEIKRFFLTVIHGICRVSTTSVILIIGIKEIIEDKYIETNRNLLINRDHG